MTKYVKGRSKPKPMDSGICIVSSEISPTTLERASSELRDDLWVKCVVQRAICREPAPQRLIDSIRELIRG